MLSLVHLSWFWIIYYELYARSDTERLQCLTEKQAKEIVENKLYIKELEDRERILAQNVTTYLINKWDNYSPAKALFLTSSILFCVCMLKGRGFYDGN